MHLNHRRGCGERRRGNTIILEEPHERDQFEDFQNYVQAAARGDDRVRSHIVQGPPGDRVGDGRIFEARDSATGAEVVEKLLGAKTVETAIQIQSEYAKSAYEGFVAKSTKINEILVKVAGEAMKPAQNAFATIQKQ